MRYTLLASFGPRPLAGCVVAVGMVWLAGCGPSRPTTYPVRGTVTLDSQPVAGAQVMLMPEDGGRPGQGITDASGRFTIGTFTSSDGALPGRHAVTVVSRRISGVGTDPDGLEGDIAPGGVKIEWLIPQRYSSPKTSGLTVEVASGMSPLDIHLQSP